VTENLPDFENLAGLYYREPLDPILGVLDDEGDLIVFHYALNGDLKK
jgi:hypothetical protein